MLRAPFNTYRGRPSYDSRGHLGPLEWSFHDRGPTSSGSLCSQFVDCDSRFGEVPDPDRRLQRLCRPFWLLPMASLVDHQWCRAICRGQMGLEPTTRLFSMHPGLREHVLFAESQTVLVALNGGSMRRS